MSRSTLSMTARRNDCSPFRSFPPRGMFICSFLMMVTAATDGSHIGALRNFGHCSLRSIFPSSLRTRANNFRPHIRREHDNFRNRCESRSRIPLSISNLIYLRRRVSSCRFGGQTQPPESLPLHVGWSRMTRQSFDARALASPPSFPCFIVFSTVGVSSNVAAVKLWSHQRCESTYLARSTSVTAYTPHFKCRSLKSEPTSGGIRHSSPVARAASSPRFDSS